MSDLNMNHILEMLRSLSPQERLKLIIRALPEIEKDLSKQKVQHRKSLLGVCSDLGVSPLGEDIDQARGELWGEFPREDI